MARILLIDDEPDIRILTRMMLEKAGHDVVEAVDGEDGMKMLAKERPDLILLDVMMPGIKGWEVCEKIKKDRKTRDIPVVMFTIRGSEDSVRKSYASGADAHINKPFEIPELIDTVNKLLK
jgi:two-component system response regulator RpaA